MVAAGGVLFFNGLQMYEYYQIRDVADDLPGNLALYDNVMVMRRIRVVCADVTQAYSGPPELISLDIHGSDSVIPIELAGAAASVVFYVRDAAVGCKDAGKGYVSDSLCLLLPPVQWAFLLAVPFFTSKGKNYDEYDKY